MNLRTVILTGVVAASLCATAYSQGRAADLGPKIEVGYVSISDEVLGGSFETRQQILAQLSASIVKSAKERFFFEQGFTAEEVKNDAALQTALERSIVDGMVASIDPSGPVVSGIRKDLVSHTTISLLIAASLRTKLGSDWAFVVSSAIGLLKEVVHDDLMNCGTPDYSLDGDLGADLLGSIVGAFGELKGVSRSAGVFISVNPSLNPSRNSIVGGIRITFR